MKLSPVATFFSLLCSVIVSAQIDVLRRGRRPHETPSPLIKAIKLGKKSKARFNEAEKQADAHQNTREKIESSIIQKHMFLSGQTSSSRHQAFRRVPKELRYRGRMASEIADATEFMMKKKTKNTDRTDISTTKMGKSACLERPECNFDSLFRTMDGTCNNIKNPLAGAAGTPLIRFLRPAYSDRYRLYAPRINSKVIREIGNDRHRKGGKHKEGKHKGGKGKGQGGNNNHAQLPSARFVSSKIFSDLSVEAPELSLMFMQWGQFIDHDLDLTPVNTIESDEGEAVSINCCNNSQLISSSLLHTECFPIAIPADDPLYGPHGTTCMNFVRSLPAANTHCTMGQREQMNGITSFIDGSMIYGSSDAELEALRSDTQRHRLKTQADDLLPEAENTDECPATNGRYCFKAGDGRVNEQTGLTMIHTLWMREHNRIADFLKNHLTDDDEIFFTARRIVGAQLQHITYNEFLPLLLGNTYVQENSLLPVSDETSPYYTGYDDNIDPSVSNVFATAAFRFGHSMIQGMLTLQESQTSSQSVSLSSQFFNPFEIYEKNFRDAMCRGLTVQSPQKMDRHFTQEIMGLLFKGATESVGLDLTALNIQRGRDHGLQPYNTYRRLCGLQKVNTFLELANGDASLEQRLREVYDDIDDVDLFVGGILEPPFEDSILGPTFQCLIGDQFSRLKNADRYYYENINHPNPFSKDALNEIKRNSNLAAIFCQNAGDFSEVPASLFKKGNRVSCDQIPKMDLSKFLKAKKCTTSC